MAYSHSPQSNETDRLLTILANQHCRATLSYVRDSEEETTSIDDLVNGIRKQNQGGEEHVALQLHHSTLPRLEEVGVIDHDRRSETVRYRGHPKLEILLESISEQ